MGDQIDNNQDDTGADNDQAAVDQDKSDDAGQDGAGSDDKGDDAAGDDGKGAKDDKAGKDDDEPVVRKKTAQDYVIDRQRRKLAKQQNASADKDDKADDDDDAGDDDVSLEDEKVVDKIIQKKYGDKFAKLDEADDKAELQTFLAANKDFEPYKDKIWKFWQHPSRNHLPIQSVAFEVAGKDLMKIGAKRAAEADTKAKQTSSGGNSGRSNQGGKVDYANMSNAEILAAGEAVKRGNR